MLPTLPLCLSSRELVTSQEGLLAGGGQGGKQLVSLRWVGEPASPESRPFFLFGLLAEIAFLGSGRTLGPPYPQPCSLGSLESLPSLFDYLDITSVKLFLWSQLRKNGPEEGGILSVTSFGLNAPLHV